MCKKFKFIHTSDIHFGDVLHCNYEPYNKILFKAQYNAFEYICEYALKNKVDFILISGDIFHRNGRSVLLDKYFYKCCEKLNPIKVYIICGNHDPMEDIKDIFKVPKNVCFFNCEKVQCEKFCKNSNVVCRIIGRSYKERVESKKIFKEYEEFAIDDGVYNIGMLHTQLDNKDKRYVPASLKELKDIANINYWALGHIHKSTIIKSEDKIIAYSGMPQGYDFGEEGDKGTYVVDVDENNKTNVQFLSTCFAIWRKINLDMYDNSIKNLYQLENLVLKRIEKKFNCYREKNISKVHKIISNIDKVYILKVIVEGVDSILINKNDDIEKCIKDDLNNELLKFKNKVFIQELSIVSIDKEKIIKLKEDPIYKDIADFFERCLDDEMLKKRVKKNMGKIWEETSNINLKENRFLLQEDEYEFIIQKAFSIVQKKFLESSD